MLLENLKDWKQGYFTRVVTVEIDGKTFLRIDRINRDTECNRVASEIPRQVAAD